MRREIVDGGEVFRVNGPHRCTPPPAERYDDGDIFQCHHCKQRYMVVSDRAHGEPKHWYREGD